MSPSAMQGRRMSMSTVPILYDRWFILAAVAIIAIGLMMVASTSIVIADRLYHQPFHYLVRQIIFLTLGLACTVMLLRLDTEKLFALSQWLLPVAVLLLCIVLIPGLGRTVNGSRRWLHLGLFGLQVSELCKLFIFIYLSGYLVRHLAAVQATWSGFIKPMVMLAGIGLLLLLEPDYGAAVVILATALGMFFIAGVRLTRFSGLFLLILIAFSLLAIASPYRLQRLTTFMNPWANQFDSGYQLTQSLIAFGRGGWWGVGLGESVQKLFYLPEAHTDFLFAVMAEELGLLMVLAVIFLYGMLVARGLSIARWAMRQERFFAGFLAYGLSLWIGLQTIINIGVNTGLLPTKGLTLPLMSYGGSSMLVNCMVLGLLFRIDYENRITDFGFR